jgi:hypothetical protein
MTGPQGAQGIRGTNGSAYVNHPPSMNVTVLTGYYSTVGNYTRFTFNITAKTMDADNDTVQTMIYNRRNTTDVWKPAMIFFATNATTSVSVWFDMAMPANQKMYWALQAWDGCEITMKYHTTTVLYP